MPCQSDEEGDISLDVLMPLSVSRSRNGGDCLFSSDGEITVNIGTMNGKGRQEF
jgi:hypothetical protein